jgi:hypothetical protein
MVQNPQTKLTGPLDVLHDPEGLRCFNGMDCRDTKTVEFRLAFE